MLPMVAAKAARDRKSTRLNSSHQIISYAVFCLKKKKNKDATGQIARRKELIRCVPAHFSVYSGDDLISMALMLMGGHGNISVTAFFFFNDTATTEIYTLSLHDALPI